MGTAYLALKRQANQISPFQGGVSDVLEAAEMNLNVCSWRADTPGYA